MKKISLLACLLCLFQLSQLQAAPILSTQVKDPVPIGYLKDATPVKQSPLFPVRVTNPKDGSITTIYARLQYENEYNSGYGLYGDVVVRFYEDYGITPTSVTELTVNFTVLGFNGTSNYNYGSNIVAYGEYTVVASNQEHDYDDGDTFRYKDYYLAPGDYYSM